MSTFSDPRNAQMADMQEKLDEYHILQSSVLQQQREIDENYQSTKEQLAQALQDLESTRAEVETKRQQKIILQNCSSSSPRLIIPEEVQILLDQKDEIIQQQSLKIDQLESIVAQLQDKTTVLESQNQDKSRIIEMYEREISRLNAEIEKHDTIIKEHKKLQDESDQRFHNIFNAQVFKALKKKCRSACIANLQNFVARSNFPIAGSIVAEFNNLVNTGKDAGDAATNFLTKFPGLLQFTPYQERILQSIGKRISTESLEGIKARLNVVGDDDLQALSFQEDFFNFAKDPGGAEKAAENFLEEYPTYFFPLTERAKAVLSKVGQKVSASDYRKLYSNITSDQGGRNAHRVLFHGLVAGGWSHRATANAFIRGTKTDFNSFISKFW